ncbi:alkaline phosphatase family protein [Brevibacillus migulae]|uniref:alkaline phosphatase family protein n=1 Tax=Brevibacillus migulae TaxID=1644114 RepID=UPI00142FF6A0|nr:alkaline phosphatase family protein [Brevibacillus migulae]
MIHRVLPLILPILLLFLAAYLLISTGAFHWQDSAVRTTASPAKRKVIILLVDSLIAESLEQLVRRHEVPALAFLLQKGAYRRDMISSFPTMSVTIDSTLLTGTYADQHRIPGLLWFHPDEQRTVDYGDGLRVVWKPGPFQWLSDSFYRLNQQHLSKQTPTLHEELAARGYTSASINGLLFRGPRTHHFGIKAVTSLKVQGPDLLALGGVAKITKQALPDGPFRSMGMNNDYTAQSLIALVKEKRLPDVTLAYFPDMDGELHKHGPASLEGVRKLDQQLQSILNAFGSWEEALDRHVFILTGDSGVTATHASKEAALIDMEQLLSGLSFYRLGTQKKPENDVAVAVNGRMSYVYALSERVSIQMFIDRLAPEKRIDLIAWKDQEWIHVLRDGKQLSYRTGGKELDEFNQRWELRGDRDVLKLEARKEDGKWFSTAYPDGLRRLHSALHSHPGRFLICTALPGSEFAADGAPNHPGGGNHGSLDASDSFFPFAVATNGPIPEPPRRVVDVKAYILSLLTGT